MTSAGSTPTASSATDEKAKKVRDLLSSYYGTQQQDSQQAPPPSPSSARATRTGSRGSGLDSAAFDADRWLTQLLRTSRLDALMVKHVEMSTEIKSLDSDMQMLVYENYNKFISATDTIRSMKSNVDGMDSNMHELKGLIEAVTTRSGTVNSKLQLRRDNIEELNQVRALLAKLQAVFDLPRRLRTAIDQGAIEIAVNSYADAAPLLKRYGHKGAFRQVAAEAGRMAQELTEILKKRMTAQQDEAAECIQMVRKLGEPIESLQTEFLLCMHKRMEDILKQAELVAHCVAAGTAAGQQDGIRDPAAWGFEGGQPPLLSTFAVQLDQRFLTELARTAALFQSLFEASGRKELLKSARQVFGHYIAVVKQALNRTASFEAGKAADQLLAAVQSTEDTGQSGGDWGAAVVAQALYTISNDVTRIQGLLPELSPQDRGVELVEGVVRSHIGACFEALQQRIAAAIGTARQTAQDAAAGGPNAGKPSGQALLQALHLTSDLLLSGSGSILAGLQVYQQKEWVLRSWRDVFVDLVQGQLQHLFLSLLSGFMKMAGVPLEGVELPQPAAAGGVKGGDRRADGVPGSSRSPVSPHKQQVSQPDAPPAAVPPGLLLLLARLCLFMETNAVLHVMEVIAATFPGQGGGSGGDQPPAFVAGEVARRLGTAAQALLAAYVDAHGRRLTLAVRRSIDATNWLHQKEPRGPRPICDLLLERISDAEAEVRQLVEQGGEVGGGPNRASWSSRPGADAGALEQNVARLFRDKVKFSLHVEFTQASILAGIVKVGLKSLVECIRLQTLGRQGLQQLQLDAQYLRHLLKRYAQGQEAGPIHQLLEDVLTAAVERSLEPQLLEGSLVERIISQALTNARA
eukprot:jgi/Astpho2/1742/Aster-04163